jgi:hypothetical protein
MLKFEAFVTPPEPDEAKVAQEKDAPQRVRGMMEYSPPRDDRDQAAQEAGD